MATRLPLCLPLCLTLLLALASRAPLAAEAADPARIDALRSLHYGEVLFHYYQRQHFPALVQLRATEESQRLGPHGEHAALLDGALALAYRMPAVAEQRFRAVLDSGAGADTRQRAWLQLGKLQHRRGAGDDALASLDSAAAVEGVEAPQRAAELRLLRAQIQHQQGRPAQSVALLEGWSDAPEQWQPYARYNLAAAQLALGDEAAGRSALGEVAALTPYDSEQYALADRARLALGLHLLRAGEPAAAGEQLQGVRLSGPFSSRALLATGWADAERGDYRAALRSWQPLVARDSADPAVQEGLLASAYAQAQLDAHGAAASGYEQALLRFDNEYSALEAARAALAQGALFSSLPEHKAPAAELPAGPLARYLAALLSGHAFREALAEQRDLAALAGNLDHWSASMGAFDDMLATREARYTQHRPSAESALAGLDLNALWMRRDHLRARFDQASESGDQLSFASAQRRQLQARLDEVQRRVNALSRRPALRQLVARNQLILRSLDMGQMSGDQVAEPNPAELRLRQRIARLRRMIGRLPRQPQIAGLNQKLRLLRGVQLWELQREQPQRRRRAEKSLNQLDRALAEAERGESALSEAVQNAPQRFAGQRQRIADLGQRLADLQLRLQPAQQRQRARLTQMVADELAQRQARLQRYRDEARLALAQTYDRAARAAESEPEAAQ